MTSQPPTFSQADLLAASVRLGNRVDIIVMRDETKDRQDVRATKLHEIIDGKTLVLGQTVPPISTDFAGREIEVTFVTRIRRGNKDQWLRTGYYTKVQQLIPNYRVGPGEFEPVIMVAAPTVIHEANLRMYYRMVPPAGVEMQIVPRSQSELLDKDLARFVETVKKDLVSGEKTAAEMTEEWLNVVNDMGIKVANWKHPKPAIVMDISLGGARLTHPRDQEYALESLVDLTLTWESFSVELPAKIVRAGKLEGGGLNDWFTCVQYVDLSSNTRQNLNRLLASMARYEIARRQRLAK